MDYVRIAKCLAFSPAGLSDQKTELHFVPMTYSQFIARLKFAFVDTNRTI